MAQADPEGTLRGIWLAQAAGSPMIQVQQADAVMERGLVGDRYYSGTGAFSRWAGPKRELSLIAEEAIAAILKELAQEEGTIEEGAFRRNLVTTGIPLTTWVGATFSIGEVVVEGLQPCAPCRYLERLLGQPGLMQQMKGRGGLRARILEGGTLQRGDPIHLITPPRSRLP